MILEARDSDVEVAGVLVGAARWAHEPTIISDALLIETPYSATPTSLEYSIDLHVLLPDIAERRMNGRALGMFHTHPHGGTEPSQPDLAAHLRLADELQRAWPSSGRCLMIIAGADIAIHDVWRDHLGHGYWTRLEHTR